MHGTMNITFNVLLTVHPCTGWFSR